MFVQVIQGRTSEPAALRAAFDRWAAELAPSAVGYLGSTAGVTADGRFICLARFESTDAARRNSDRPEQGAWWSEASGHLEGEATFHDSEEVDVDLAGDPDRAGFVQVMQGRSTDPARARHLMTQGSDTWASFRPDVLGSLTVDHGDGSWTTELFFTSEAEAREGERKEPPPELQAQMAEMASLTVGEVEFFDLEEPWIYTPR